MLISDICIGVFKKQTKQKKFNLRTVGHSVGNSDILY